MTTISQKKLIVLDGNALVHRAFHALPPFTTRDGLPVGAVYGFTSILLKILKEFRPDYLACTFDLAGPTFRHEAYAEYKAKRVKAPQELYDQIPLVHEVVSAFGIPIYEKQGFEADDVIGTIAREFGGKKISGGAVEVLIFTGDQDTLQLVRPGVKVYALKKGISEGEVMDDRAIKKKFGLKTEQLIDYKILRGDPSDNIPGVPGIGEKTAVELLQKFESVEELYSALHGKGSHFKIAEDLRPAVREKLLAAEKDLAGLRNLVVIRTDVPVKISLEEMAVKKFSREDLLPIFQRFEFTSLLKRLPEIVEDAPKVMRTARKLIAAVREFGADDVVKIFADADQVAVIPSVVGRPWNGVFHGLALAVSKNGAVHEAGFVRGASAKVFKALKNFKGELIGHDLKSLIAWTPCDGAEWNVKLFDTMIASYLLHPGTRTHDLRSILLQVLGVESATSIEEKQPGLFGPDFKAVAIDAQHLLTVAENFRAELEDKSLAHLFDEIEMPLTAVLAQMEKWGVALDTPRLNKLSGESVLRIEEIAAKMYKYAGGEFNIASPLQLRDILYEKLGLGRMSQGKMIVKKGKTGLSTAASELEKLRGEHPIIELLEEHRELSKLQSTYLEVLPGLVDKKTGRVHTSFNQAVTATGRLSSSDPNLQNIPVRTELGRAVRTAFVATRGYDLLSADYSQIELRIAASLSNDEKMIAIFKEGEDIHKRTAAEINGVPLNQVTKEMRYGAKEINFGVLYGMGVFGLASRTGITHDEARSFIEKYFATFPGLQRYIVETKALAEQLGYVETMFGRRRYIPEMKSANVQMRNAGERMAVNHPIQGTAADMIKMAMIAVARYILKTHGDGEDAPVKMILQVHDELIFEVKHGLTKELAAAVRRIMSGVVKLKVPMVVNVSVGSNWGELEELSEHD